MIDREVVALGATKDKYTRRVILGREVLGIVKRRIHVTGPRVSRPHSTRSDLKRVRNDQPIESAPVFRTPTQHRSRLPVVAQSNTRGNTFLSADTGSQFQNTPMTRQPLHSFNAYTLGGGGGGGGDYGFSAGMKIGKQQIDGSLNRPTSRGTR